VYLKTVARRQELIKDRALGIPLYDCVQNLARKYHVSPRTVYHDWTIRRQWLPQVLEIEDPVTFAAELIASHKELQRFALKEYLQAQQENARIGALNLVRRINVDLHELMNVPHLMTRLERLEADR
jgi:hypothetical protein